MTFEEAVKIVRKASTAEGQMKMPISEWDNVSYARKILAEEYLRVQSRIAPA